MPYKLRTARFRCVMALYDPKTQSCHLVEGTVEGRISSSMRGHHGFGYDPVFELIETGETLAEMQAHVKNSISHRFRAVELIKVHLLEHPFY